MDPDQTAPITVCPEFTLFASILNLPVKLGNYLQKKIAADDIFKCIFFFGALTRVNSPFRKQRLLLLFVHKGCLPLQFEPRSGLTKFWARSGSKLFDTVMVFLIFFFKKDQQMTKHMKNYPACKELNPLTVRSD